MKIYHDVLERKRNELINQVNAHPFLVRCRGGDVTMGELLRFLGQQGLYSRNFTRYLCALMANLPRNEDVLHLSENSKNLGSTKAGTRRITSCIAQCSRASASISRSKRSRLVRSA